MTTGNLLAIIVGLLIVLAILWFMTRSRKHHAATMADDQARSRQAAGASPDGLGQQRVTSSAGVATADAQAGTAFAAPDVPLNSTDGNLRSQGGASPNDVIAAGGSPEGHDSTHGAGAAGVAAIAAGVATAGAAVAGAGVSTGSGDDRSDTSQASGNASDGGRGGDAMSERPRFDPAIDGHPVPGDTPDKATAASAVPSVQAPAERANAPVDPHRRTLDIQGGVGTMRAPDMSDLASADPALEGDFTVDTDDAAHDVREMMKILNLRDSEAKRLDLSVEEYDALRRGDANGIEGERVASVAERLRRMIR